MSRLHNPCGVEYFFHLFPGEPLCGNPGLGYGTASRFATNVAPQFTSFGSAVDIHGTAITSASTATTMIVNGNAAA